MNGRLGRLALAAGALLLLLLLPLNWQRPAVPALGSEPRNSITPVASAALSTRETAPLSSDAPFSAAATPPLTTPAITPDPMIEALRRLELDIHAAAKLSDPDERTRALSQACLRWAAVDPSGALALARQLELDETKSNVVTDIIQRWAAQNTAAAFAWLNNESTGDQRERLVARMIFGWSQSDPAAAARFVVEQIPLGPEQAEAGLSVLHQWAKQDPAAAARWVARFPSGELRDRATAELELIRRYLPEAVASQP